MKLNGRLTMSSSKVISTFDQPLSLHPILHTQMTYYKLREMCNDTPSCHIHTHTHQERFVWTYKPLINLLSSWFLCDKLYYLNLLVLITIHAHKPHQNYNFGTFGS